MVGEGTGVSSDGGTGDYPTGYIWSAVLKDEGEHQREMRRRRHVGVASLVAWVVGGAAAIIVMAWRWGTEVEALAYCTSVVVIPAVLIGIILWLVWRRDAQNTFAHFYLDKTGFEGWIESGALLGMLSKALEARGIPFVHEPRSTTSHVFNLPAGLRLDFSAREVPSNTRARLRYLGSFFLSGVRGVGVDVARDVQAAIDTLPTVGPYRRPPEDEPPSDLDMGNVDLMYQWD